MNEEVLERLEKRSKDVVVLVWEGLFLFLFACLLLYCVLFSLGWCERSERRIREKSEVRNIGVLDVKLQRVNKEVKLTKRVIKQ